MNVLEDSTKVLLSDILLYSLFLLMCYKQYKEAEIGENVFDVLVMSDERKVISNPNFEYHTFSIHHCSHCTLGKFLG